MKQIYKLLFIASALFATKANALNYFWVGGTGNWSDTSHWATTTGGNIHRATAPTLNDNVFFDSLSFSATGQSVNINITSAKCRKMDWSTALHSPAFTGSVADSISIYGTLIFNAAMSNTFLGDIYFLQTTATDSIRTNGIVINGNAIFNGTGTYNLKSSFTTLKSIILLRGTLKTNSKTVNCKTFNAVSTSSRSLNLGGSSIFVSGSGNAWDGGASLLTITAAASKIIFTNATNNTVNFNSGGAAAVYNIVNFQCANVRVLAASTYDSLLVSAGTTIVLPNTKTQSLGTLVASGTCSSPITIKSDSTVVATISKTSATANTCNYLRLSLITKTGSGPITANNSIIEVAPCAGWTVNAIASATTFYWIGGNGNWSSAAHWSLTSGGVAATCIPGPGDNVVFNTSSGFSANDSVIIDKNAYCNNITFTGALPNPILAGTSTKLEIKGSLTFVATMSAPFSGMYNFVGAATQTITSAGVQLNADTYFNNTTGQWQLSDALVSSKNIILLSGHFNTQNKNVTCFNFVSNTGTNRQLTLGSSTFTITGYNNGWDISAPFTLNAGTSEIVCNAASANVVTFNGAGLTYNNLTLNNKYTAINSSNTFNILKTVPGRTITLQSGRTQTLDSIVCNGTCSLPITIEASSISDSTANINKTGDTLTTIDFAYLRNVTASTTTPHRTYKATNSVSQFTTTGWTVTGSTTGGKRYWIGGTGNWSSSSHWSLTSGGVATSCIPTKSDTVLFDANSFSGANQIVTVDIDGYCSVMDWTGAAFNPELLLVRNVIVKRKAILNPAMQVSRFGSSAQIQFTPAGNNVVFDSKKVTLNTDILFYGQSITDTLKLLNHLYMSDTSTFNMVKGTFITNNDSINAGFINFSETYAKSVVLGSSYVSINYGWNVIATGSVVLNAGTSTIKLKGNNLYHYFFGDGLTYNNLIFSSPGIIRSLIRGSNTYNDFTVFPGVQLQVTSGTTQTINGNFVATGNCTDSIKITSTVAGSSFIINKSSGTSNTVCLRLKDISRTGGATFSSLFSTNMGNVTGWTFDPTPSSTANFNVARNICLGGTSVFTNTSTSYLNGAITYLWKFGDGTTDTTANPTHTYSFAGKKKVTLTTTLSSSSCSNTRLDSVMVNSPSISLSCSDVDSTICAGSQIEFDALGQHGSQYQFLVDGIAQSALSIDSIFQTTTLTNGQIVRAIVTLNGCTDTSSQAYPIRVNPLPNVLLNSTAPNDSICVGSPVTYTASGAEKYQFFIDNIAQGFITTNNVFTAPALTNGQVVKVLGYDTVSGCNKVGVPIRTMVVSSFPTPTLTCSTSNLICANTPVTLTGSGATSFEFFVNGVSQGASSAINTFTTDSLHNGNIVTLKGTRYGCTALSTNNFVFTVNPIPVVSVTNNSTGNIVCAGQSVTFTASGANQYQFFVNNVAQGGASGNSAYTTSTLTNGQTITVVGTSNSCVGTSTGTTITVNPLPVVNLTSSDADNSICLNQSVTFTASGASTYEFFINGISQGTPSASTTFTTSSITNAQTVSVKGYSALGCVANGNTSYTFTVLPAPSVNFYCSAVDTTICAGQSVTFTALGANTYQFFVDGISQGAASSTNTFITSTLPAGSPLITVIGTNNNGCSAQSLTTFPFTVNPIPTIALASSDADNHICNGTSVTYTATGASVYQFYINGVSQGPLSAIDTFLTSTLITGQIVSVSGSQNGCSSNGTPTYQMTVTPQPAVTFASSDIDNIICEGQQVQFTAGGATSFEFFINGLSQGTPSASTSFASTSLANNDSITVTGTTSGCSSPANNHFIMQVNPLPLVSLACSDADTIICRNESVTFTATGANLYEFFINGTSQSAGVPTINSSFTTTAITNGQTVTVRGTSNYGCSALSTNAFTFVVHPVPSITLTSSDADNRICVNDTVTFTAQGASAYQFFINGVAQDTLSSANTFSTGSISNLQTVSVQGTNNGCTATSPTTYTFNVYVYPTVNLASSIPSGTICAGDAITFTGSGANLYQYFIDSISQGAPNASSTFTTAAITNGQTVYVTGVNVVCPTSASQTYTYSVTNYPVVTATASTATTICYGTPVTFTCGGAATYEFYINGISQGVASSVNTFTTNTINNGDVVSIKGYNGNCGVFSATAFTFTVNKLNLTISSSPANMVCQGSPITFTAAGANTYQFFVNATSQGAASANNTFTSSSLPDGAIVTFIGNSNATGCAQQCSYQQYVTVVTTPTITHSGNTTFCQNDSLLLHSNFPIGNQWLMNGNAIANATDSTYYVHTSGAYSLAVTHGGKGTIWSVGADNKGQLGDSAFANSFTPTIIKHITNIKDIDAGNDFNIALDSTGNVFVWGDNMLGQLGDGTFTTRNFPYQLPSISNANAVSAGANHSLVVLANGDVQSFGNNTNGQLGIGNNGIANFPTAVNGLSGITAVSGGEKHSLALKNDGTVWAWGANSYGQLGDGTFADSNIPVIVHNITNAVAISAGKYHSMALRADSTLWVWGNNAQGQLGTASVSFIDSAMQIPSLDKFIAISAGNDFCLALTKTGNVVAWGDNQFGQLGDGSTINSYVPTAIPNFNGVTKIKAGTNHSFAGKQDLSVWAWGNNVYGQLGNSNSSNATAPIHITALSGGAHYAPGLNHTCVAMDNETVCSASSINVTVTPAPPIAIYDHVTSLSTDPGASYQWYYNNSPILHGTTQTQNIIGPGNYFVQVTYANGCTVSSAPFGFMVGIADVSDNIYMTVFPNPANDYFTLKYNSTEPIEEAYITDVIGKRVLTINLNNNSKQLETEVSTSSLTAGVYFVCVRSKSHFTTVKKIVIEK